LDGCFDDDFFVALKLFHFNFSLNRFNSWEFIIVLFEEVNDVDVETVGLDDVINGNENFLLQ
jgi:hypothetical protein